MGAAMSRHPSVCGGASRLFTKGILAALARGAILRVIRSAPVSETNDARPTKRSVSPGAEEILGLYFPVLDHGFVSLVDYMGTDEDVERAARVSYGYGTRAQNKTRGLIRYL